MHHKDFKGQAEPCKSCEHNRGFAGCAVTRCVLEDRPRDNLASMGYEAQRIREAIRQFGIHMAEKMKSKIGQRSGWDDRDAFPLDQRLGRLAEECNELLNAIKAGDRAGAKKEVVDVGNMAMMIWFYFDMGEPPEGWNEFSKNI